MNYSEVCYNKTKIHIFFFLFYSEILQWSISKIIVGINLYLLSFHVNKDPTAIQITSKNECNIQKLFDNISTREPSKKKLFTIILLR